MKQLTHTTTQTPPLAVTRAEAADMAIAVEAVRSSAHWYAPLVDEADMGEHEVDLAWARRNFETREVYIGRTRNDAPVGVLTLQDTGDYLYVGYLYLFTDQVGQGFGRRFLEYAAAEAKRRHKRGLVLICHPEATWACKAYAKFGFREIATEREAVLAWNDGWLAPYYEEGFGLYRYELREARAA